MRAGIMTLCRLIVRGARSGPGPWVAILCLFCLGTLPVYGKDSTPSSAGQNEPVVSKREAEVLERAEESAKTDLSKAIAVLRESITPESSAALTFALACYLHECGDDRSAEEAFRETVSRMPSFHRARMNLAKILLQEEKHEEAARELVILLDSGLPGKLELWKMLGYAYLAQDLALSAEVAYRNALVFAPEDRDLVQLLIQSLVDQGKWEETRSLVNRELARNPLDRDLWNLLANIDLMAGRTEDSLVHLECTHRLGIAGAEAMVTLGDLYLEQGLAGEAMERFAETAAMEHPPAPRLINAVEGFVYQGDIPQARALLDRLDALNPDLSPKERLKLRSAQARVAEAEGDLEKALCCYENLLREAPLDADALLAAGDILQKLGRFEEALIYYERAGRISPEHEAAALIRQAQIAVEREDYKKAAALLEGALEITPEPYIERYLDQVRRMLD